MDIGVTTGQGSALPATLPAAVGDRWIFLSLRDGAPVQRGMASARFGTPLPRPDGGPPDGIAGGWHWDGYRLVAETDGLGFQNLFVYQRGSDCAVSDSPLRLIAEGADPAPDARALAVFTRIGLFLNEDTPFRHIRVLPPGGRLEWQDGRVTLRGGRPPMPRASGLGRDAAVEAMIEMPRAAIARSLAAWDGPIVLPLSGGRDSRHLLLELRHQGRAPDLCITFQHARSGIEPDAAAARAICAATGQPHAILGAPRRRAHDILRALVLTGLCADEHAQMLPLHDMIARGGMDQRGGAVPRGGWATFDGIAGDILTNPDDFAAEQMRLSRQGDFTGMALALIAGHERVIRRPGVAAAELLPGLAGPRDEAVAYLAETIATFADAPDPYQVFWFWHRTRREISHVSTGILGRAQAVFTPFLDRDFVDLCLSLSWDVTSDQQLHNLAMARAYPAFAAVPHAEAFARPAGGGGSRLARARARLRDGADTVLALGPRHPLREMRDFLFGTSGLHAGPSQVWQLYRLLLTGLDAGRARDAIGLAARLAAAAPTDPVSDLRLPGPAA